MSSRSKLARNALASVIQMVCGAVLLFALYRFINITLGVEQLGIRSVVLATVAASHLADLGLSSGVTRFVARDRAREQNARAVRVVDTVLFTIAGVVALLAWPLFILGQAILPYFFQDNHLRLALEVLPLALVSLWLTMLSTVLQGGLDGCQRMELRAGLVLLGQVALLGMAFWLVPTYGLKGLAWAQVTQAGLLVVFGRVLLCRALPGLPILPSHWSKNLLREMLGYGMNMQAATVLMLLFDPVAKALMARFGGAAAAGYFEMANQVVLKVRGIVIAANQAIVPYIAEMKESAADELRSVYAKNIKVLSFVVIPTFSTLLAWAGVVSWLLLGQHNLEFISLLGLLTIAWAFNIFNAPAYFFNMGTGKVGWNTLCHLLMASISTIFGFVLGPYYGMSGVAAGYGAAIILSSMGLVWIFGIVNNISIRPIIGRMRSLLMCLVVGSFGFLISILNPFQAIYSTLFAAVVSTGLICTITILHPTGKELIISIRQRMNRL